MSQQKLPYIALFPGDWLKDPVSGCSMEAQGLWLRMLFIMHESPRRGYLCEESDFAKPLHDVCITRRCGISDKQYAVLLNELGSKGVFGLDETGVIFSRKMVKEEALRNVRKAAAEARWGKDLHMQNECKPSCKTDANAGMEWNGISTNTSTSTAPAETKEKEIIDIKVVIKEKPDHISIPDELQAPDFEELWEDWKRHLREKKIKTTPSAFHKQLKFCVGLGLERATVSIENSIRNNWQGLFEPREDFAKSGRRGQNTGTYNNDPEVAKEYERELQRRQK